MQNAAFVALHSRIAGRYFRIKLENNSNILLSFDPLGEVASKRAQNLNIIDDRCLESSNEFISHLAIPKLTPLSLFKKSKSPSQWRRR